MMDDIDYQKELCSALKISIEELNKSFSIWRFNVLHVRGLDALTSEDVYEYFQRKPHSIEWLSNISCNVTFDCINEAFESLMSIAKAIIIHKNEIEWLKNSSGVEGAKNLQLTVETSDRLTIPVPPNYRFVMGEKHPKAKTILIRFATINDRKAKQVENEMATNERSQQQIRVPTKQSPMFDSNVRLRRVKRNEMSMDIDDIDIDNETITTIKKRNSSTKQIRMRMRADEEEERIQRLQRQRQSNDLRSRLLNRSTRIDRSFNNRINMKAKRSDSIWRRIQPDDTINKLEFDAKTGRKYIKNNRRTVTDLRNKLNEPIIRVQVTYDDDEIFFN